MSLFRRRRTSAGDASVDMTPMLDIVFILLIFFIVTATFLDEEAIALTHPPMPPTPTIEPSTRAAVIYINETGLVTLQNEMVEASSIANRVETLFSDGLYSSVIMRSHEDADLGLVIRIKDDLDYNDIQNILKVDRNSKP